MNTDLAEENAMNAASEVTPVLKRFDAALDDARANLSDPEALASAISVLAGLTKEALPGLQLSEGDAALVADISGKLKDLERNLHMRDSILTGFSHKLKELVEG